MSAFDIFNQFATDPAKEIEGAWETVGPPTKTLENGEPDPDSTPRILIARNGNKRHGRIVSKLYEANKTLLDTKDDAAEAKGEEITIEGMAKAVYLGWANLSFAGKVVPNSASLTPEERLAEAKRHLAVKDYRVFVMKKSEAFERFKAVQAEADAGN